MTVRSEDCLDVSRVVPRAAVDSMAPGAIVRELTRDERTGGEHVVIECAPLWSAPAAGYSTSGQDFYVVDGALTVGPHQLATGSYMYVSEGVRFGPLKSERGCRVIVFRNKSHNFVPSEASAAGAEDDGIVGPLETWSLPWKDPMQDIVKKSTYLDPETGRGARPPGVLTKTLRHLHLPNRREMVALTSLAPGFIDPGTEHHPHDECLYLVAGDAYIGLTYDPRNEDRKEDLKLQKDHYIARPPGIRHGPVCTQTGALWLIYMNDKYTGLYTEVPGWKPMIRRYMAEASYR